MSVGTNIAAIAASLIKASRYRARASRLSRRAATDRSHGRKGLLPNAEVGNFPLLSEEGWTRPQQNIAKPPLWSGRGGDQIPQNLLRLNTTPSARAEDASRRFLDRAATPPRRGGENSPLQPFGQQPRKAVVRESFRRGSSSYGRKTPGSRPGLRSAAATWTAEIFTATLAD